MPSTRPGMTTLTKTLILLTAFCAEVLLLDNAGVPRYHGATPQ